MSARTSGMNERSAYGYGHTVGEVNSSSRAIASSSVAGLRTPERAGSKGLTYRGFLRSNYPLVLVVSYSSLCPLVLPS